MRQVASGKWESSRAATASGLQFFVSKVFLYPLEMGKEGCNDYVQVFVTGIRRQLRAKKETMRAES